MTTTDVDALRKEYEEMKRRQAEQQAQRDARKEGGSAKVDKHYWKPAEGANVIRIVPIPGNDRWYKKYRQAWINKKPIVPPSSVDPEAADPHRDLVNRLRQVEGDKGKEAFLKVLDKEVITFFIVDRAHEDLGVQQWTVKPYVFMDIQSIMFDAKAGLIYDPKEGLDLLVVYTKGMKQGSLKVSPTLGGKTPLGTDEQIAEWTSVDLWQAYRVGVPSDPGYVQAVIDGTTKEWWDNRKAEWEAKRKAESQEPAEEADPVAAPTHSTQDAADAAVDALAAFAPKFYVKSPKDGSTLPEPMTLADVKAKFGEDVEVQDMEMSGWKALKELL